MKKAKLFKNGQSQAVRLSKKFCFKGEKFFFKKTGKAVLLLPAKTRWDILFNSFRKFSNDFMKDRKQPKQQHREDMF